MLKRFLLITVGIAALVLNPFFGCGKDQEFRYGADEMRVAIEGTWKLTVPAAENQPAQELVLSISQAGEPTQQQSLRRGPVVEAAACAQRSLVKSAGACVDMSDMPIDVKLLADGGTAKGMFRVFGLKFVWGDLEFPLGTSTVRAKVAPDGTISEIRSATQWVGATMVRVSTAQR